MGNRLPEVNEILDFSGSLMINESHDNKDRFQSIYSGNNYGTDYSVYAKFFCEDIEDDQENIKVRIDFFLINYKGIINIGFLNDVDYVYKEGILKIKIFIKGLEENNESKNGGYIILPRKSFLTVLVERKLYPLSNKPVSQNGDVENCFVNGVFDDQFYYREGNFFHTRKDFDNMTMENSMRKKSSDKIEKRKPGHRCIIGKNLAYVF